jgi:hypothetical protein
MLITQCRQNFKISMATPAATSIGIGSGYFTTPPKPKNRPDLQTPNSKTTPNNTKENASFPIRSIFGTLRSLTTGRKVIGGFETQNPNPAGLGRRKSVRDLFARRSQKGTSSEDPSRQIELKRAVSVSPLKLSSKETCEAGKPSPSARNRT